jgi:transposase InsO family protein
VPWGERSTVSLRREFVMLALQEGSNIRELCRRYEIQPRIGYKWLDRHRTEGEAGLEDRSRRPRNSPGQTSPGVEAKVVSLRRQHPCWGGRKLARRLRDLGMKDVPSPSTVTAILHRNGLIDPGQSAQHRPMTRFEHDRPNALWQMDFKGHFSTAVGRCHPLTVLDDHSRFALAVAACSDEQLETVRGELKGVFRRYGLPDRMLMDNGAPWGSPWNEVATDASYVPVHSWTVFEAWLLRLGVRVSHGRPYHPQTQGKDERFHRTLRAEVIGRRAWRDPADCGRAFEVWRHVYNAERPHEALKLATPASRYRASPRAFPEHLPQIDYGPGAIVRKVQDKGLLWFNNRTFSVGKAFIGEAVALRPTTTDGRYDVVYCQQKIAALDLGKVNP